MLDVWHDLIERIHATPMQAVIAVTGGGAAAISQLLGVPGGSRTLLEAVVPYSEAALTEWLGRAPDHFCVEETALAMAAVAYQRACRLAPPSAKADLADGHRSPVAKRNVGVACTASLVSDRPKKGEHRCHIATQTGTATATMSLVIAKGARDRMAEEGLVGNLILMALARAMGLADLPQPTLSESEIIVECLATADPLLVEIMEGQRGVAWSLPESPGSLAPGSLSALHAAIPFPLSPPAGLLCGAFHPLHFGHRQLREVAERELGGPVYYEMSIRNVDKPALDFLSLERRRAQFTDVPLALTAAPTFAEKAAVLPGVTFIVGVDTAARIVHPRYHGGSDEGLHAALSQIGNAGCRFLVAGRKACERFETLADIALPAEFASLFKAIPVAVFRADISSTSLRHARPS